MAPLDAVAQEKADAAALEALVAKDEDLEFVSEGGRTKVHFKSTGHNEPGRLKCVEEYMKGGKYRKAREWYSADFKQFEPDIIQHVESTKFLFCNITATKLPKTLAKVEAHLKSTRFKEMKKKMDEAAGKETDKIEKKKALRQKLNALRKIKFGKGKDDSSRRKRKLKVAEEKRKKADAADQKSFAAGENKTKKKQKKNKPGRVGQEKKKAPARALEGRRKKQFTPAEKIAEPAAGKASGEAATKE